MEVTMYQCSYGGTGLLSDNDDIFDNRFNLTKNLSLLVVVLVDRRLSNFPARTMASLQSLQAGAHGAYVRHCPASRQHKFIP